MNIQFNTFSFYATTFFKEHILLSLSPLQYKILAIASVAFACLSAIFAISRHLTNFHKEIKPESLNEVEWDKESDNVGYDNFFKEAKNEVFFSNKLFCMKHGQELDHLRLGSLDDQQLEELLQYCPNIDCLTIHSEKISDQSLEHLKGMPLTMIDFTGCSNLTEQALDELEKAFALKGVQLKIVRPNGVAA